MEEGLFHETPVREAMTAGFVEARLHTDRPSEHLEEILALQKKYSGTVTLPVYIVLDPSTGEAQARMDGVPRDQADWLRFLDQASE